jgi:hypothetical protein
MARWIETDWNADAEIPSTGKSSCTHVLKNVLGSSLFAFCTLVKMREATVGEGKRSR